MRGYLMTVLVLFCALTPAWAQNNGAKVPICPENYQELLAADGIASPSPEGTTLPVLLQSAEAKFSTEFSRFIKERGLKNASADSLVSLVVNTQGKTERFCIRKPAGYGLDEEAVKAVEQYRFKPAMLDGKPVSVQIFMQVNFRQY